MRPISRQIETTDRNAPVKTSYTVVSADWAVEEAPDGGCQPSATKLDDRIWRVSRSFDTEEEAVEYAKTHITLRARAVGLRWLAFVEVRKCTTQVVRRFE